MRFLYIFFFILIFSGALCYKADPLFQTVDAIVAIIFGEEENAIITKSELGRPSLMGTVRTLEEIIFELLVYLDAKKHNFLPTEVQVDKYLAMIQKDNNLSHDDLRAIFLSAGYSFEEGREQLMRMQAVNMMIDMKVRSNLIISQKEIDIFYAAHPVMQEESYFLEIALIPYQVGKPKEIQRNEISNALKKNVLAATVVWGKPFWINYSDIADNRQFVYSLKSNETYHIPIETDRGFEIYRLKVTEGKRLKPLDDERRQEITDILRKPKYVELLTQYKKTLFDHASILYL